MRSRLESVPTHLAASFAALTMSLSAALAAPDAPADSVARRLPSGGTVVSGHAWPAVGAPASPSAPAPVLPEGLTWASPPGMEGLRASWVVGSEKAKGPYLLRVRLAAGARLAPHTHPDHRVTTVLSGTAYVGFGAVFDENALVAVPAGGVYEVPAGIPHYAWAKDGDVEYQESGAGPTGTAFPKP